MTIQSAIEYGIRELRDVSDTPHMDAEHLCAHAMNQSREYILAHLDARMSASSAATMKTSVDRRLHDEPLAYSLGRAWFYGIPLSVNSSVLIPRPETELLVDAALAIIDKSAPTHIVDIGTGSGAIAIAIATHTDAHSLIDAIDISPAALTIAKKNAESAHVRDRITFHNGNLLEPLQRRQWKNGERMIILANLPYVPDSVLEAKKELWHEPRIALSGGHDGLDSFRGLLVMLQALRAPWSMILETDPLIHDGLRDLLHYHFPDQPFEIKKDLYGDPRVLILSKN